jgi:uncharacterized RmlC-like cupin family protein
LTLVTFCSCAPRNEPAVNRGQDRTAAKVFLKLQESSNIYFAGGFFMDYQPIRVIRPGEFDAGTAQTPGSLRMAAVHKGAGIVSPLWGGIFIVQAGARTGIHHHGEQDTVVYVLEGSSFVRWGERGESSATVQAGDFLFVPAWLPHQEINPSSDEPFRWVVVRSTPEPIVVNLPDNYWG